MAWQFVLVTALLSSLLTLLGSALVYRFAVKPKLDATIADLQSQVKELEQRVAAGVRQGIADAFRDFSDKAVRTTTRSVARMGSELVEGGLSTILGDRGRRRDDGSGS